MSKGGGITRLPGNSLPPGMRTFNVTGHPLTNISDDAFHNSANTLRVLRVKNGAFRQLADALKHLNNLTTLEISGTYIENWRQDIMQHMANSLNTLWLDKVGLSSWPSWIYFFHSLKSIRISDSPLILLPESAFSSVEDTLEELYLLRTKLTQLPSTANISGLTQLDLEFNENISQISADRLSPNIQYLNVMFNNLTELTDTSFPNNSSITELNLSFNPIIRISHSAFKPLIRLRVLTLNFIRVTEFPLAVTSLTNLATLSLIGSFEIACDCPVKQELAEWFQSYNGTLEGTCFTFVPLESYLTGDECEDTESTTTNTTNGLPLKNAASLLTRSICYIHNCLLLLIVVFARSM